MGENGGNDEFWSNFLSIVSLKPTKSKDVDVLNKLFNIDSKTDISSYTLEQIRKKGNALHLNGNDLNLMLSKASDASFFDRAKTGTLTWGNAVNDTKNSVQDLTDKLKELGKISEDQYNHILTFSGDEKLQRNALKGVINDVDGLADSMVELGEAGTASTGFFESLSNAAKGFVLGLRAMLPAIIAIGAAFAAWKIFEYSQTGFTRATEKMNTSVSEYQEAAQELDSLNSKLDETKDRIAELESLQSKGVITFDEEVELEKLQAENDELERKITLQKDLVKMKQEASASATEKAANSEQSFYEYNKEKYGFWGGLLHTATGYLDPQDGINDGRSTAEQWKWQNNGDTTIPNQLKSNLNVLEQYQDELQKYEEEHYKEKGTDSFIKKQEELQKKINDTKEAIAEQSETVQGYIDGLTDSNDVALDKKYEQDILKYKNILDDVTYAGKTSNEKNLSKLKNFFSTTFGSNLQKSFTELIKNGKTADDVLEEFKKTGLSLDDIGVDKSSFLRYFQDIERQSKETSTALKDYSATASDVEKAGESANQDKNWSTISSSYKTAKELLEEGKTGVDDFQSVASFLNPKGIKEHMKDVGKYSADAYQKAFQDAMATANRWFGEDEAVSMKNFVNDFKSKGLFDVVTDSDNLWDITANFKTSAEAADKFGISVDAVETMLDGLKAYGYIEPLKDIKYSTQNLTEYKNALQGLEDVYDSMENGDSKKRLEKLLKGYDLGDVHIDGFEEELEKYQEDMDSLPEEKIIRIKLEYDLASIQQQIDQLQKYADEGGDSQTWAELNANKRLYREKSEDRDGNGIINVAEYQAVSNIVEDLRNSLKTVTDDKQKRAIQNQISNIYDAQNAINDLFADSGKSWEDFIATDEYQDALNNLVNSSDKAADDISKLLGEKIDGVKVKVDADTSPAERKILGIQSIDGDTITMDVNASTEQIQEQLDNLQVGQTLKFNAEINGEDTWIEAVKNEDGTITYTADYNGVKIPVQVKEQDGKVTYYADETRLPTWFPDIHRKVVYDAVGNVGSNTGSGIGNGISNIVNQARPKASGTMLSVAKADGTAYNVVNTIPILKAHASGNVGLGTDQRALVNEEEVNGHSESIVRDVVWRLIPGGAHLENLKKGDIIFSAQQTEDLLRHGKTPGHATRAYADGTSLSPAYRLGNHTTSSSGSKSSSKSSSSNSSSSSSSDTSADAYEETLDEIEIKIKRIERDITNLDSTVQATYKSWSERNKALISEMSNVRSEIEIQQQAYNRYMQEAESVGLSSDWAAKIREGRIEIEKITDEDLKKKPAAKKSTTKKTAAAPNATNTQTAEDPMVGKPCPLCGKGTIIKGKTAYGCSNWKEGCQYRQPFDKL